MFWNRRHKSTNCLCQLKPPLYATTKSASSSINLRHGSFTCGTLNQPKFNLYVIICVSRDVIKSVHNEIHMQSLPGHRPWLLTAINRVSGQGRCPGRLCHGVSGQGRRPGRLCHGISGQGRCPGRQLGFVLAFRVEKHNIGSSRNRNPVGAVYSN